MRSHALSFEKSGSSFLSVRNFTPAKLWFLIFGLWVFFLSGVAANFVGSPGIIQSLRLHSLLVSKTQQVTALQSELRSLQSEASHLDTSKTLQEREIRRVLGYAAPDEIIFDFSSGQGL